MKGASELRESNIEAKKNAAKRFVQIDEE